jgi:hypothetical protein
MRPALRLGKAAPLENWDAEDMEVIAGHGRGRDQRTRYIVRDCASLDLQLPELEPISRGDGLRHRHGLDACLACGATLELLYQRRLPGPRGVERARQHDVRGHESLDVEADVGALQLDHLSYEEAGRREQHDGQCHLRANEHVARTRGSGRAATSGCPAPERATQIQPRDAQRGEKREQERAHDGGNESEEEHVPVDRDRFHERQRARQQLPQCAGTPPREEHPSGATRTGDDESFHEELPHETRASGAE